VSARDGSRSPAARLVARATRPAVRATRAPWTLEASVLEERVGPAAVDTSAPSAVGGAAGVGATSAGLARATLRPQQPAGEPAATRDVAAAAAPAASVVHAVAHGGAALIGAPAALGLRASEAMEAAGDEPARSDEVVGIATAVGGGEEVAKGDLSEPARQLPVAGGRGPDGPGRTAPLPPGEVPSGAVPPGRVELGQGPPREEARTRAVPPGPTQLALVTQPHHHDRTTTPFSPDQAQVAGYPAADFPPPQVTIDQIQIVTPPARPPAPDPFASLAAQRVGASRHGGR